MAESSLDQPPNPSEVSTQFKQVGNKLRMILHLQPNHYFVFGLSLFGPALYVLLADREGIFYTAMLINIHKASVKSFETYVMRHKFPEPIVLYLHHLQPFLYFHQSNLGTILL